MIIRYHGNGEDLYKQFLSMAEILREDKKDEKKVLINLQNGTFEVSDEGWNLRDFQQKDGLTYQLPFSYIPSADCPKFKAMLQHNLPEQSCQRVLAEYIASIFVPQIKLEKCLILYGGGSNGKSVIFEIISALLGANNVSSYTLRNLTGKEGYQRAELADKLLNYATEINPRQIDTGIFKTLVSREPIEARRIYGRAFMIRNYAKLMFNCNLLPEGNEISDAYYRRFAIIPFNVKIPESQQNLMLAQDIISEELPGIFNWVLEGLGRFLEAKRLTESPLMNMALNSYRELSDSVGLFVEELGYRPGEENNSQTSQLYSCYSQYCRSCNLPAVSMKVFSDALTQKGFRKFRTSRGMYFTFSRVEISEDE